MCCIFYKLNNVPLVLALFAFLETIIMQQQQQQPKERFYYCSNRPGLNLSLCTKKFVLKFQRNSFPSASSWFFFLRHIFFYTFFSLLLCIYTKWRHSSSCRKRFSVDKYASVLSVFCENSESSRFIICYCYQAKEHFTGDAAFFITRSDSCLQ